MDIDELGPEFSEAFDEVGLVLSHVKTMMVDLRLHNVDATNIAAVAALIYARVEHYDQA